MSPKISIIIPSFNEEKHISRCLDSVLNQTFTDFEVLCVDDGSTDKTCEIIEAYSKKDSRIIPLKNPDKGVSSARNFGIENSNGEYIGFVDSDDFIQPQMYEFLYRAVTENNCDFSVCRYKKSTEFIKETFEYKAEKFEPEKFICFTDSDFNSNNELIFSAVWTKLFSKSFLSDTRFKNYRIGEDTAFNSEIYSKSNKSILVDLELYNYYINLQSVSFTDPGHEKWFDFLETRFISYENLKNQNKILSSFYLDCGIRSLVSYRFNIRNSVNKKLYKNQLNQYSNKYVISFFKCKDISLKNRIIYSTFVLIPSLYTASRKIIAFLYTNFKK